MSAKHFIFILMILASRTSHAGNFDVADKEALEKQKREWRAINIEYLKLKKELEKTEAQWTPFANVETEHAALIKKSEQALALAKILSERRYRVWTSAKGAKVYARLADRDETTVRLKDDQGQELEILVADLSQPDQAHLQRLARALSPADAPTEAPPELIGLDDTLKKSIRVAP